MHPERKAWFQIHLCTLLWGFTAILGKLIQLQALPLVFWRMLLVSALIFVWPRFWRGVRPMSARTIAIYAGIGLVITLHWVTFYASIKLSNASIAATCMALTSVFLALIEPITARRRFDPRELVLGVAALPGVALVVGGTPGDMRLGVLVGVFSALTVAIFSSLNKRFLASSDALTVTGIEMAAGALALALLGPFLPEAHTPWQWPDARDAALLVVLAVGCTLLPFALWLVALRHLSAFSTALAINLEPVYSVALASLLFSEQRELTPWFYLGVVIVIAVAFGHPLLATRRASTV